MSRGRPRICVTGGWFSSDNVGDHAILTGLLDILREEFLDPEVLVITADPGKVTERYGLTAYAPRRTPFALLRALAGSDALVFTGGTPFYDKPAHMTYYTGLAVWAWLWRKPIAIYGISLRTLRGRYTTWLLRRILKRCSVIGARELRTKVEFERLLGHLSPSVRLVPDPAFAMRPTDADKARDLISAAGLDPDEPFVAVSLRDFTSDREFQEHHYSRELSQEQIDTYVDVAGVLVERLITHHGVSVLLCPMHVNPPDDDRRVMRQVLTRLGEPIASRVGLIEAQLGPRDMKAVLGRARACVGVRFHSVVLAMSMNVPTLALAYARKNSAIMDLMGMAEQVLDLAVLSEDEACRRLDDLIGDLASITVALEAANERMRVLSVESREVLRALPAV